ncbi:unnamed protein product [Effrenium voratum]|uniref:EF-hand domain-containing protein n=1 Tax=Effrenium voratum TaxID=2562239 RepID=A0AA36J9Z2_9DINO|nr:unnamed protein product [Effrenium voratum]
MRLKVCIFFTATAWGLSLADFRALLQDGYANSTDAVFLSSLMDASSNGAVDLQEFQAWSWQHLALSPSLLEPVFSDLDFCQAGELQPSHLDMLIQTPSVVLLRALLASRFQQHEYATLAAADLDDDGALSAEEFRLFLEDLSIGAQDAAALFALLDSDGSGTMMHSELAAASAGEPGLLEFRRLATWTFASPEESFLLADADGNGWISEPELHRLGCQWLALKGNVTTRIFQAMDLASFGQVSFEDSGLALGVVQVRGFRTLLHSVFTAPMEAFLTYDDGDQLLQHEEFEKMAAALAIGSNNSAQLFALLASRGVPVVHMDIFLMASNGLAQLRTIVRESYVDLRSALLDIDTEPPWNEVSLEEFRAWCERLQLPAELVPDLFMELDTRKEGKLLPSHFQMLLAAQLDARAFGQLVASALSLGLAFEKADADGDGFASLEELIQLAWPLGIRSADVAKFFTDLDIDKVGYLSRVQFEVMSEPFRAVTLSNSEAEQDPIHMYEIRLYEDDSCLSAISCEVPISSGHFRSNQDSDFSAGYSFDGNASTRWTSQCGPCRPEAAWIGCKFAEVVEVRCLQLVQTGVQDLGASVALHLQIWNGKSWDQLADIAKPAEWELSNGAFTFKPLGSATSTSRLAAAEEEGFEELFGVSLPVLASICAGVGICGLLCLCVLCPIFMRPACLDYLRVNAPERVDARRAKKMDNVQKVKQEVKELEEKVQAGAVTLDEWGMPHKVKHDEQKALERQLDKKRRQQAKYEVAASAGDAKDAQSERMTEKQQAELERYKRMKEAYEPKTIAVDGVALRAPESVLLELGFEPEMIEAFAMPGFSSVDANPDEPEEDENAEEEEEEDDEDEDEEEVPTMTPSKYDDGRVTIPAMLDEAPAIFKDGTRLMRRGAMAGVEEGKPMDPEELKRAMRKAAGLKGAEIVEDDVEKWISQRAERGAKVLDWEAVEVDKDALQKERNKEAIISNINKTRLRALAEGDRKELAAELDAGADSGEEDLEQRLARAAAQTENLTMTVFQKEREDAGRGSGQGRSKWKEEMGSLARGKSSKSEISLARGKTKEEAALVKGKSKEFASGKSKELASGKSKEDMGAMKPEAKEDLRRGKSKEVHSAVPVKNKSKEDVHAAAMAAAEAAEVAAEEAEAEAEAAAAALKKLEQGEVGPAQEDQAPQPYGGEVFAGMPVIPRGLGTPRRDMLAGEVYRSSLDAPLADMGDGLQWGRFLQAKPHFRTAEEIAAANAPKPKAKAEPKPPEIDPERSDRVDRGIMRILRIFRRRTTGSTSPSPSDAPPRRFARLRNLRSLRLGALRPKLRLPWRKPQAPPATDPSP